MTYILNIPGLSAELLAIGMVQHAPDERHRQFVFEGEQVGVEFDEVVVVTYERKRKPPTLERFIVAEASVENGTD